MRRATGKRFDCVSGSGGVVGLPGVQADGWNSRQVQEAAEKRGLSEVSGCMKKNFRRQIDDDGFASEWSKSEPEARSGSCARHGVA